RRDRCLMDSAFSALDELEVLDDIGDVDLFARKLGLDERPVEDLAGRTDEGGALQILRISRLLPDQNGARGGWALPENRLRRLAVEVAAAAGCRRAGELGEITGLWHERRGASDRPGDAACFDVGRETAENLQIRISALQQKIAIARGDPEENR